MAQFETIPNPSAELQEFLWENLRIASNAHLADIREHEHHSFVTLAKEGEEVVGGMICITYFRGLNLQCLWVREDKRGKGFGREFLAHAEQEARRLDCTMIHLHTFSFQAPNFYLRNGYQIVGIIDDYPPGEKCYFLKKGLD